jgi:DNA-binding CsgD family transcriptional regulator
VRPGWLEARERVERACAAPGDDERALRVELLRVIRTVVPFDSYVWVVTDPLTAVGALPLAEVPSLGDLPVLVALKYRTALNRWTALPADRPVTLVEATGGQLDRSLLWSGMLHRYGVRDVLSAVLRDRFGCWGFLDLWRAEGSAFSAVEQAFLADVLRSLTAGVRAALAATFAVPGTAVTSDGPAVLLLSESLEPRSGTPDADAHLRALLPTPPGRSPVPAVALNVAAQLLAVEAGVADQPASARLHGGGGRWLAVRAARFTPSVVADIAVTIEQATPPERLDLFCRASGLTPRESEVVGRLVTGADTRGTARALGITEHTVNDHLRSIFAKTGTRTRRQLVAQAQG